MLKYYKWKRTNTIINSRRSYNSWSFPHLISTFLNQWISDRILPHKDIGYGRSASNTSTMSMKTSRQSTTKLMQHDEVCHSYLLQYIAPLEASDQKKFHLHPGQTSAANFWTLWPDARATPVATAAAPLGQLPRLLPSDVPGFVSTPSMPRSSTMHNLASYGKWGHLQKAGIRPHFGGRRSQGC